ncbi:MAG TPA: MoaD/ThiS family protein [Pyrinomonadaceae bacterium]|nr:MoaD/ThiS family protein [Pyrinomonadaceae bacterium]
MNIQVLFFGATADIAGTRRTGADVSPETLAKTVFDQILAEHPSLAAHKLHFSVNQEFATGDEILNDGDELAIFTAVSGG